MFLVESLINTGGMWEGKGGGRRGSGVMELQGSWSYKTEVGGLSNTWTVS